MSISSDFLFVEGTAASRQSWSYSYSL